MRPKSSSGMNNKIQQGHSQFDDHLQQLATTSCNNSHKLQIDKREEQLKKKQRQTANLPSDKANETHCALCATCNVQRATCNVKPATCSSSENQRRKPAATGSAVAVAEPSAVATCQNKSIDWSCFIYVQFNFDQWAAHTNAECQSSHRQRDRERESEGEKAERARAEREVRDACNWRLGCGNFGALFFVFFAWVLP